MNDTTYDFSFMNTPAFQQAYSKMSEQQRLKFVRWLDKTYPPKPVVVLTGVN